MKGVAIAAAAFFGLPLLFLFVFGPLWGLACTVWSAPFMHNSMSWCLQHSALGWLG